MELLEEFLTQLKPLSKKEKALWDKIDKARDSKIEVYIRQRNIAAGEAMLAAKTMIIGN